MGHAPLFMVACYARELAGLQVQITGVEMHERGGHGEGVVEEPRATRQRAERRELGEASASDSVRTCETGLKYPRRKDSGPSEWDDQ
ncbi:hypothetical protein GSI_00070 [Ganoderma sinense ZZ0214-1]|uniref:Uncharacterized protein n=1 Tax=Ganoderma sinense ZZ0214-1 TaxID=1077348 RepID=A0A2G8SRL2_9APHY|nr:hypothetical protein GSI_00070 [Ganoderma sinense ZZ0214-1]